jgi:ribosomal protein S18 acetylase RimI-like enzyme
VTSTRHGSAEDAVTIAALATQVFLDTYAGDGIRPDLAREAFNEYSTEAFAARLGEPGRLFILAERDTRLVGFVELIVIPAPAPSSHAEGAEIVRLYVQPGAQGQGLGTALLQQAEAEASSQKLEHTWLTAWESNPRALEFYAREGYADVGTTQYVFEGRGYTNRVLLKRLAAAR